MKIRLFSANHRTAPVELRERLALPDDALPRTLATLRAVPGVGEAVLLSTCNRVELCVVEDGACVEDLEAVLGRAAGLSASQLSPHLQRLEDEAAVRHVFRVASSLDSMVLGEPQINGQVKEAYRRATDEGSVGPLLHKLFHKAFAVAKRVRTETAVGASAVSVASAAVDLAGRIFDELPQRPVLLLGAGEMGELALKGFRSRGCRDLWIANRTLERAAELAAGYDAAVLPWSRRVEFLTTADVVLCSTGATEPVLTRDDVARARRARRGRPLFLIDISVPRNLDPAIRKLDPVYLFDVDDLGRAIDEGHESRRAEAERAERIVDGEVTSFGRVLAQVHTAPLLRAINLKVREAVDTEIERTLGNLGGAIGDLPTGDQQRVRKQIESMGAALAKRLLHDPIAEVRRLGEAGDVDALGAAAKVLGVEATLLSVRQGDARLEPKEAAVGDDG